MKFNWIYNKDELKRYFEYRNYNKTEEDSDYITNIRAGVLCYDLIERYIDGIFYLYAELYVGGIDSGYGYVDLDTERYPYDYCDSGCRYWKIDDFKNKDINTILETIEADITERIIQSDHIYEGKSLVEMANEELHNWQTRGEIT